MATTTTTANATVKWFSKMKGYGFVTSPDIEGDILVHQSVIDMEGYRYLKPNQQVVIVGIDTTDSGMRALKVEII